MDETTVEVLKSFPPDRSKCEIMQIMQNASFNNEVYLQYFLCKLNVWGYVEDHGNGYSVTTKGLEYLRK